MTKMADYPNPEARYGAALEGVKAKLQGGELFEKSTSFERRMVDIPALRKRYGLTQQQFADAFGIAIGTLRNWEQGRRVPEGPAQRLLEIIEDRPNLALEVLTGEAVSVRRSSVSFESLREPTASPDVEKSLPIDPGQRLAMRYNDKGVVEIVRVDRHVGERLRQRRWMVGMTQQQLADKIGIKFQQIQKYETGRNRIDAGRFWDLAVVLEIPVSFFYEGLFVDESAARTIDAGDPRDNILTDKEALELVRAYYAMPETQRRSYLRLGRVLSGAAEESQDDLGDQSQAKARA